MKRFVPLALVAGAILTCTVGTSQAAALSGAAAQASSASQGQTLVSQARWWRHWH